MKRFGTDFLEMIKGFDLEVLEKSRYSIYALSKELKFIYFNPAWYHFAIENDIDQTALYNITLGSSYTKSIKGIWLKFYFRKKYKQVIKTGKTWHYQYDCSSADTYRYYLQTVYPLNNKSGVLIVNTEMFNLQNTRMNLETFKSIKKRYVQPNDLIIICPNCKHTKRADKTGTWDWVPDWASNSPVNTSLEICPTCRHLFKD